MTGWLLVLKFNMSCDSTWLHCTFYRFASCLFSMNVDHGIHTCFFFGGGGGVEISVSGSQTVVSPT